MTVQTRAVLRSSGIAALSGLVALCLATSVFAAPGPSDPQAAAVQSVIDKANQEQSDALVSGDPSGMSDTATAAYFRQLTRTNLALVANGVTGIHLDQLTWGTIQVNGSTATANTSETWTTTFGDGTSVQSTDNNVYSLVNRAGTWLIASDNHPTTTPTSPPPAPSTSGQNTSENWAGYTATTGTYTGVTGTWNVPQPAGGTGGVGATWVGIGGANSQDLIQAGTEDTTAVGDQHQYEAWIEMLPMTSQQIPVAVAAGDSITVSINEMGAGSGSWQISLVNNTSGESFETSVDYPSSESSAEWIEEAPSGACGVLPLDNFKFVSFSGSTTDQNGATVNLREADAQPMTLVNAAGQPEAVPSAIGADGASFQVTRTSAQSTPDTAGVARCVQQAAHN